MDIEALVHYVDVRVGKHWTNEERYDFNKQIHELALEYFRHVLGDEKKQLSSLGQPFDANAFIQEKLSKSHATKFMDWLEEHKLIEVQGFEKYEKNGISHREIKRGRNLWSLLRKPFLIVKYELLCIDVDFGAEYVVGAMNAMVEDDNATFVKECGCAALSNLAEYEDNQVAIAAAGGINCVHNAMRQHPSNFGIQEQGCSALGNMAMNEDNKVSIAQAGGIDCILTAMESQSNHASVQEQGCAALANLVCYNNENRESVGSAGGIVLIVNAMSKHLKHAGVQENGCRALMNLAYGSHDNQVCIATSGGINRIRNAIEEHKNRETIIELGRQALQNLVHCEDIEVGTEAQAAIQCIDDAVQHHSNNNKRARTGSLEDCDREMPASSLYQVPRYDDFDSLLHKIQNCRTIDEFRRMYNSGTVYACLERIRTAFRQSGKTIDEWVEDWAKNVHQGNKEAKTLDRDRKLCLELLYTLLDRWKDKTLTTSDVVEGFGYKRVIGILGLCLPMDCANALFNMTLPSESKPGMHWVAKVQVARDPKWTEIMANYSGIPTMNKRLLWLMEEPELDELKLGNDKFMKQWTEPREKKYE